MAAKAQAISREDLEKIRKSQDQFDLSAELNSAERQMFGELVQEAQDQPVLDQPVRIKDIEEDEFTAVDVVELVTTNKDYNERYAHYLRCQSLAALVGFEEGWNNFQEMILKSYVRMRRLDNRSYRGDNRDTSHALRLKQIAAEDFLNYINSMMSDALQAKKPSIKS